MELEHRISASLITGIVIKNVGGFTDKIKMQEEIQKLVDLERYAELKVILQEAEGKKKTFKQYHPNEDLFAPIAT
jgi:hypothetical protein